MHAPQIHTMMRHALKEISHQLGNKPAKKHQRLSGVATESLLVSSMGNNAMLAFLETKKMKHTATCLHFIFRRQEQIRYHDISIPRIVVTCEDAAIARDNGGYTISLSSQTSDAAPKEWFEDKEHRVEDRTGGIVTIPIFLS